MAYAYEILPRPDHLGSGWRLRLLENGEEVGGGVFPLSDDLAEQGISREDALADAFADAEAEAYEWLDSRPGEA